MADIIGGKFLKEFEEKDNKLRIWEVTWGDLGHLEIALGKCKLFRRVFSLQKKKKLRNNILLCGFAPDGLFMVE